MKPVRMLIAAMILASVLFATRQTDLEVGQHTILERRVRHRHVFRKNEELAKPLRHRGRTAQKGPWLQTHRASTLNEPAR